MSCISVKPADSRVPDVPVDAPYRQHRTGAPTFKCYPLPMGHHWSVPIVRNATRDDAESIGEAHAEAGRIGYDEPYPSALLEVAVDLRRRMWVGLVDDLALGGMLLVTEQAGEVVGFIHFGPASENDEIAEVYGPDVLPSS